MFPTFRRDFSKLLLAALLAVAAYTPAHSQATSTIFLTDRNGQIPFPILPPNRATGAAGSIDNMIIGGTTPRAGTFTSLNSSGQACTATPCVYSGIAAAQGGSINLKGGTSSTSGNAGGASLVTGGVPGATGVGGAATIAGGAGGATSGAGGVASLTGGAGTAGNSAGGIASVTGGAGQGTAAGGIGRLVGGASGAGATGNGGAAQLTGGAALSTNGNGGSVVLTGGAKTGSGIAGSVIQRGVSLVTQGAPTAKTVSATLTAAEVVTGIITVNQGAAGASAQQLPLATDMDAAIPDAAAGDAFDFSVINISTVDAEDASVTTNTGWTLVGNMDVPAYSAAGSLNSSGRFRARKTGTGAWVLYRIS